MGKKLKVHKSLMCRPPDFVKSTCSRADFTEHTFRKKISAVLLICVATLFFLSANLPVLAQQEFEIKYDDGVMERWWTKTATGVGGMFGVLFSPPFTRSVLGSVRIFFAEDGPFQLLVFDCSTEPAEGGCSQVLARTLEATGSPRWFVVDLTDSSLILEREFLVAVGWTTGSRPKIGVDENSPQGRSWSYDTDTNVWERFSDLAARRGAPDGNLLIRATVRPAEYAVTIDAEPRSISMLIDGQSLPTQDLPRTYMWEPGSQHTLAAPEIVEGETGVRYVFSEWNDGSRELTRTITISGSSVIRAIYKTQYELRVQSELGEPQGSGWYDAEAIASFGVTPTAIGFLVMQVFDGWTGDSSSNMPNDVIVMDSSKTVVARWRTDYTQLLIFLGFTIGLTLVGGVAERSRKKRAVQART